MSSDSVTVVQAEVGMERLARRAEEDGELELAEYVRLIKEHPETLEATVSEQFASFVGLAILVMSEDRASGKERKFDA